MSVPRLYIETTDEKGVTARHEIRMTHFERAVFLVYKAGFADGVQGQRDETPETVARAVLNELWRNVR